MMLGHWSDLILYSTALQSFSVDSDNPDQSLHDFKVQLASPTPPTDSSIIQTKHSAHLPMSGNRQQCSEFELAHLHAMQN